MFIECLWILYNVFWSYSDTLPDLHRCYSHSCYTYCTLSFILRPTKSNLHPFIGPSTGALLTYLDLKKITENRLSHSQQFSVANHFSTKVGALTHSLTSVLGLSGLSWCESCACSYRCCEFIWVTSQMSGKLCFLVVTHQLWLLQSFCPPREACFCSKEQLIERPTSGQSAKYN